MDDAFEFLAFFGGVGGGVNVVVVAALGVLGRGPQNRSFPPVAGTSTGTGRTGATTGTSARGLGGVQIRSFGFTYGCGSGVLAGSGFGSGRGFTSRLHSSLDFGSLEVRGEQWLGRFHEYLSGVSAKQRCLNRSSDVDGVPSIANGSWLERGFTSRLHSCSDFGSLGV